MARERVSFEKPNPDEAARQRVQKEPPRELIGCQGHQFLLAARGIIFPAECNLAVAEVH